MKINIKYFAQIKKEAGKSFEELEFKSGATLQDCIKGLIVKNSINFNNILFDESGTYLDSVILIVNGNQVRYDENPEMIDGDELMLMSPIAGG